MLNLYLVRATDYGTLPIEVDPEAFETNLQRIEGVVAGLWSPTVWAAWGNCVSHYDYFVAARDELLRRLSKYDANWVCFGALTSKGHPRHPSRLQYAWNFQPYAPTG